jgi:hypothetical protein
VIRIADPPVKSSIGDLGCADGTFSRFTNRRGERGERHQKSRYVLRRLFRFVIRFAEADLELRASPWTLKVTAEEFYSLPPAHCLIVYRDSMVVFHTCNLLLLFTLQLGGYRKAPWKRAPDTRQRNPGLVVQTPAMIPARLRESRHIANRAV